MKQQLIGERVYLFQSKLWNFYDTAIHGLACTNNGLEQWHNSFWKQVGSYHVSILKLFEGLQKKIGLTRLK